MPITQGPLGAADGVWRIDRFVVKEKIEDFAASDFVGIAAWDLGLVGLGLCAWDPLRLDRYW